MDREFSYLKRLHEEKEKFDEYMLLEKDAAFGLGLVKSIAGKARNFLGLGRKPVNTNGVLYANSKGAVSDKLPFSGAHLVKRIAGGVKKVTTPLLRTGYRGIKRALSRIGTRKGSVPLNTENEVGAAANKAETATTGNTLPVPVTNPVTHINYNTTNLTNTGKDFLNKYKYPLGMAAAGIGGYVLGRPSQPRVEINRYGG